MAVEIDSNSINENVPPIVDYQPKEKTQNNEISVMNEYKMNHLHDNDSEKIQTAFNSTPSDSEMIQNTSLGSRIILFISKIPYRSKTHPRLKIYQLFKFADKLDILLMIIGTIAAMIGGACFPLMLYLYRDANDNRIDMGKLKGNGIVADNISRIPGECFTLFRNILRQEIAWFDVRNSGDLSNRIIEDLDKVKNGINEQVPDFISLLSCVLGALIYALVTGWKLTHVLISVSPIVILTFNLAVLVIGKYTIKEIRAFSAASSIAQEALYGSQLVRTECHNYTAGTVIVVIIACIVSDLV
ncbi:unnamed protein product [Rotaria magnacalcarata]|uniref:ABC transmembrane type-1 domain-containing protein n=1 Tax=Rotaria magnacalcarata TaxID=392030 RepID=A0A819X972_9BILA|nr:unnamed protein product [Rotaria magnacalcarata]CAF4132598.1 unnamed protein product [Rotaria magnacalcarata]